MKILAPVNSVDEAQVLIACGAQELYCGLLPSAWARGSSLWLNRRGPGSANIDSLKTLKRLVNTAHRQEVKVFLTLNQPFYAPESYRDIVAMVLRVTEVCGVDAFIVGDPGLIIAIREKLPKANIHVSSLGSVLNSSSAQFFKSLGAERIIFPRYLSCRSMGEIMEKTGRDLEYEVFILNDGCVFEEGFCSVTHAFGGAICNNYPWSYRLIQTESKEPFGKETFQEHLQDYRSWLWIGIKNLGERPSAKGYPMGMCGLCALPDLKELDVDSLKIVGREAPLAKKKASVLLLREVLDFMNEGHDREQVQTMARELRDTGQYCASKYMCYYD